MSAATVFEQRDGAPPALPLEVDLPQGGQLRCERVLRHLPGRRLVCAGTLDGQPVVGKLFYGRHAERYWRREERGVRALAAHRLPAPPLLHASALGDECYAVVTAWREPVRPLHAAYGAARPERLTDVLAVVDLLARQHAAGLEQTDPHLDNFLLAREGLLSLDAGALRVHRGPLPRRRGTHNLALLLAHFGPWVDAELPRLLTVYGDARQWRATPRLTALRRALERQRRRRERRYLRKMFRSCSAVEARRELAGRTLLRRTADGPQLRALLRDPAARLSRADVHWLKRGRTAAVARLRLDGRECVVKQYNALGGLKGLRRALRESRATRSWRAAHWLELLQVPTAAPLGLREQGLGPLTRRAWLVCEALDGPTLASRLDDAAEQDLPALARALDASLGRLHRAGVVHGDLKASNLLVDGTRLALVDLDAVQRPPRWRRRRAQRRDWQRLLRNFAARPALAGRLESELARLHTEPQR